MIVAKRITSSSKKKHLFQQSQIRQSRSPIVARRRRPLHQLVLHGCSSSSGASRYAARPTGGCSSGNRPLQLAVRWPSLDAAQPCLDCSSASKGLQLPIPPVASCSGTVAACGLLCRPSASRYLGVSQFPSASHSRSSAWLPQKPARGCLVWI